MNILSRLWRRASNPRDRFEELKIGHGRTIRCHVDTVIWAREIDANGEESGEIQFYFAKTPDGKILRLTIDQLKKLTIDGQPAKTFESWSWRGEGECPG